MLKNIPTSLKIFVVLFSVFFLTASGNIDSIDGTTHLFLAKKMVLENKIYFEPAEQKLMGMPVELNAKNGKYYPIYNPGYALLTTPIIVLDTGLRNSLHLPMPKWPLKQDDYLLVFSANMINTVAGALLGVLIYQISISFSPKNRMNRFIPYCVAGAFLTTNLWIQAHTHFAHLLFLLFFLLAFRQLHYYIKSQTLKRLVLFSLFFTLAALVYNVSFVLTIIPLLIYMVIILINKKTNAYAVILRVVCLGVALVPSILIQLVWNFMRYGDILTNGYSQRNAPIYIFDIARALLNVYGMTFGPNKGLFIYSPLIIFAFAIVIAKLLKTKKLEPFSLLFLVVTAIYIGNYSFVDFWHGDEAFGPRYLTPILVLGLIIICSNLDFFKGKLMKWLAGLGLGIGLLIQVAGISIPSFSLIFLSPSYCMKYENRYFNWKCSPIKVGWSNLLKRRIKETLTTTSKTRKTNFAASYPNPVKPFRTMYPDPIFDRFSRYKTESMKTDKDMMNDIYSFTLDNWLMKGILYKNVFNL